MKSDTRILFIISYKLWVNIKF